MPVIVLLGSIGVAGCNEDFAYPPIAEPEVIGNGTWDNPLQAWQVHLGTEVSGHYSNWVTGYIVGYINTDEANKMVLGTSGAPQSNILMAQYPYDEEEWVKLGYKLEDCISVQLPSMTQSRYNLNLADHPENLNKLVSVRGVTGSKYCGYYGVRKANDYNFGAIGHYEPPFEEISGEYYCNFSASRDINYYRERGWATYMIKGGLDGWVYRENSGVSFVIMSAYYGSPSGGPYENWIVSPAFNLEEAEEKTLSFRTQASTQADTSLEVYVMGHQNPQGCKPQKLECVIAQAPASGYSSWVSSGTIDLSEYSDMGTIYIGFRYYSEHGGSGTSTDFAMTDFNLGGADPAEWEIVDPASIKTFRRTDKVESGKTYLLVFNNNLMMVPLNGNFGNFDVAEVGFNEDGTITSKIDNAFTFEALPDSEDYVMLDAKGKYVIIKGTYTNFNMESTPFDAYKWSLTPDENGIFEIRNVTRNLVMIYDASKNYISTVSPSWYQGRGAALYEALE